MKKMIFVLFDVKSRLYGNPMFVPNLAVLVRDLADEVKRNGDGVVSKHPADFELYELGSFFDEDGVFEVGNPSFVLQVSSLVEAPA